MKVFKEVITLRMLWFSAIIAFAYVLQTHLLLEGDVAYLTHVVGQLMNGQQYGIDIFETNPPMMLYLSLPIYWLVKYHLTSVTIGARLYVFLLGISSWALVSWMLGRLIAKKEWPLRLFLESLILFVLLYLPVNELGQREHIFVILTFPYVFSVICLLENKPVHGVIIYIIGLAAGLGFALKPYFFSTLILLECYIAWCKKSFFANIRIETCVIATVCILYVISIFIFQPNYIYVMLPLISHFYLSSSGFTWPNMFLHPSIADSLTVAMITGILVWRGIFKRHFSMVLLMTLLGMIISCLITQRPWFYHTIPALSYAALLAGYGSYKLCDHLLKSYDPVATLDVICWFLVLTIFVLSIFRTLILVHEFWNGPFQHPYYDLTSYINSLAKKSRRIMCFSDHSTDTCFPLVYDTNAKYAESGPFFWWLYGVLKQESYPLVMPLPKDRQAEKNFLVSSIVRDISVKKPCVIIINTLTASRMEEFFDFVSYFSNYPDFKKAFQPFVFQGNIGYYKIYRRDDGICKENHKRP